MTAMYHKSDLMLKQDQKEIKNMKHIKLNDFSDIRNTIGEYILDPTEKYVITLENEIEFQMATLSAF